MTENEVHGNWTLKSHELLWLKLSAKNGVNRWALPKFWKEQF